MIINKNKEAIAISKYVKISPFKVRRILDQIKGRDCEESLLFLRFMPHKASIIISKTLSSAISNANFRLGKDARSLVILEARADEGPSLKRFCPHAQGRGFPIKKRFSHIVS